MNIDVNENSSKNTLSEFTELWMANLHMLGGFVRLQVRDHHQAEDIIQEVAFNATANFDKYDPTRPFGAWVLGIARQRIAEYYRKHNRKHVMFSSEVLDLLVQAHCRAQSSVDEQIAALQECKAELTDRHQRLLQLRYGKLHAPEEIAAIVGSSRNSVNVMLHRIRMTLAECIRRRMGANR